VVDRFIPQAAKQEVNLEFVNSTGVHEIVFKGDPDRLTQIISNLISNSLHHTPTGGNILVDFGKTKDSLIITVRDNGSGIAEEDLPHLFERFYRGDKSRNRENSGSTGLGLSIARHLARVHGGELAGENASGGGALFTLTLPNR
jgi:signal transduction histidine kinase